MSSTQPWGDRAAALLIQFWTSKFWSKSSEGLLKWLRAGIINVRKGWDRWVCSGWEDKAQGWQCLFNAYKYLMESSKNTKPGSFQWQDKRHSLKYWRPNLNLRKGLAFFYLMFDLSAKHWNMFFRELLCLHPCRYSKPEHGPRQPSLFDPALSRSVWTRQFAEVTSNLWDSVTASLQIINLGEGRVQSLVLATLEATQLWAGHSVQRQLHAPVCTLSQAQHCWSSPDKPQRHPSHHWCNGQKHKIKEDLTSTWWGVQIGT